MSSKRTVDDYFVPDSRYCRRPRSLEKVSTPLHEGIDARLRDGWILKQRWDWMASHRISIPLTMSLVWLAMTILVPFLTNASPDLATGIFVASFVVFLALFGAVSVKIDRAIPIITTPAHSDTRGVYTRLDKIDAALNRGEETYTGDALAASRALRRRIRRAMSGLVKVAQATVSADDANLAESIRVSLRIKIDATLNQIEEDATLIERDAATLRNLTEPKDVELKAIARLEAGLDGYAPAPAWQLMPAATPVTSAPPVMVEELA